MPYIIHQSNESLLAARVAQSNQFTVPKGKHAKNNPVKKKKFGFGTLFRRFDNMKGNELTEADRATNDYISSGLPPTAKRFHVHAGEKVT